MFRKELQDSEIIEKMGDRNMQMVKLERQLKNAEAEIERWRADWQTERRTLSEKRQRVSDLIQETQLKTALIPTRAEFWGGILTIISLIIAALALR